METIRAIETRATILGSYITGVKKLEFWDLVADS